jgi:ornithine--oxo-acid transaminase
MNSGAEAVETALKFARRWGHVKKAIPNNEVLVITFEGNFHGRTLGIISGSTDETTRSGFGPFLPGFIKVPYNDIKAVEEVLKQYGHRTCGLLIEPIQGEAGVVIPDEGFLSKVYEACKKNNVLFLGDEIQTGLGRTGKLLCSEWESVRPDILILGKALSGGLLPVSCVLADEWIMSVMDLGSHGSTYGGNPLASAVGMAALQVILEEDLPANSLRQGAKLLAALKKFKEKYDFIIDVRGKGLFAAVEINPKFKKSAWDLCIYFKNRGLLAKPTHDNIIRFAPPLIISDSQLDEAINIIKYGLEEMK